MCCFNCLNITDTTVSEPDKRSNHDVWSPHICGCSHEKFCNIGVPAASWFLVVAVLLLLCVPDAG
ncbi:hypothetical protein PybrP1_002520 [[Pythium] brassicae (nom. inval.)]|nr:hypothetical protein PybrP1_002520 [[Pythium] brassicae (nom. inval.)]